ncbi:MAG: ABC transporter permease [Acidobacteria bacterium]|nr:ABC transporter permease [Acidobacteriota bacterium]MCI0724668.1 ABC transporter permease [Acidobacteriota bacterium]
MAIPLSYNFRNLRVRKTTTVMTALGIALTVAVLLGILAMVAGLKSALQSSGNPLQMIVVRKNSPSELSSQVAREAISAIRFKEGIQKFHDGEPMVSGEIVTVMNLPRKNNPEGANVTIRGLSQAGVKMRPEIRMFSGRWFEPGQREIAVGKSISGRFVSAAMGDTLRFGRGDWKIVGVFDAGRTAFDSEIWGDLNQIATDFNRNEVLSSALVRASDPITLQALKNSMADDQRLYLEAKTEVEYYAAQTSTAAPVEFLGIFVAVIMAIGSSFAAMNTMYAAVARRSREIGTLRILGFSRGSILLSFVIESLLLSLLGGLLGILLVMPLNGLESGIGNNVTFSETGFDFRITPAIIGIGISFATLMGILGGLLPARSAARADILIALREL